MAKSKKKRQKKVHETTAVAAHNNLDRLLDLQDIHLEMLSLLEEAQNIIRSCSDDDWTNERARSYWLTHFESIRVKVNHFDVIK